MKQDEITYVPSTAVWELTLACNMRCRHCGSACTYKAPGELDEKEALGLCYQLADLGVKLVTLSGGEPLLRDDWQRIAARLAEQGVNVNMITNGWLVDATVVEMAIQAGVLNCGISLDGTEEVHDGLRRKGAFSRACNALEAMQAVGLNSAVITTVMRDNLELLPQMRVLLEELGVRHWQLQLGMPMGSLTKDRVIAPSQIKNIVDFAQSLLSSSPIQPVLADCVGYYSNAYQQVQSSCFGNKQQWTGCNAGKSNIGILHNGDILGCTSIRSPEYIEGNIREMPLSQIWTKPGAFAWNRHFSTEQLGGFCAKCRYGESCLGGCQNVKLTTSQSLQENRYCLYRVEIEALEQKIDRVFDPVKLLDRARKAVELNLFEIAEMCLERAAVLDPEQLDIWRLLGYVHYGCRQYEKSRQANEMAIQIAPNDAYSWHGLGNALAKLGNQARAEQAMLRALKLVDDDAKAVQDIENDLGILRADIGRRSESV